MGGRGLLVIGGFVVTGLGVEDAWGRVVNGASVVVGFGGVVGGVVGSTEKMTAKM